MAATATKEAAAPPSSTPEDEFLKRNTDCVYFLASPLTCKKGSECEYRHSEYARVNPRDCWYWLNGNCLNPKCSFRHPPLDGLMSPQGGNFAGPSVPTAPASAPAVPVTPHGATKQAVPCIFFQKGYCLKGDRCPFLHGPLNPSGNKIQPVPATAPATELPAFKKSFGGLEKCTQPKVNAQANAFKGVEAPAHSNTVSKVQNALPKDGVTAARRGPTPSALIEQPPKYKEATVSLIDNGNSRSRDARVHHASWLDDQNFQNGRDADDSLRESSPGFDVLVDDKLEDDEYYQHEDQYARIRAHDGRSLNEFEMLHHDDYNSVTDVDPEIYLSKRGYDSYDPLQERYAWEQRGASSERPLGEAAHHDRRKGGYKSESPDFVENSDLRQRLSKHRRVNGLKSVVNTDYNRDSHAEDHGHWGTQRDSRVSPTHESSRGSRLQGRIKLPRRSPPRSGGSVYSEREHDRMRNLGRSSPSRSQVTSQQGRLRDRLSGRINDDSIKGRIPRGPGMRRDSIKDNDTDFAAPKRLSELKGGKPSDTKEQQSHSASGGKLRDTILASSVGTGGDLSFDGPKPLSEILKRKRDGGISVSTGGTDKQVGLSAPQHAQIDKEENKLVKAKGAEEEGEILNKKIKLIEGEASIPNDMEQPDVEEGFGAAEEGEEHEYDEKYDQGDGEYEYEQEEGEGYGLNEGETIDHDEEFMDEDDGDDFARKIGVSI